MSVPLTEVTFRTLKKAYGGTLASLRFISVELKLNLQAAACLLNNKKNKKREQTPEYLPA